MSTHSKKKYESIIADHFCQKNGWKSNWKYVHPQPVRTQRFGPHEGRCTNPATWRMGFVGRNVSVINKGPWADRFVFIPRSSGVGWLVVGDPFLPFFRILWLTQLINGSYALPNQLQVLGAHPPSRSFCSLFFCLPAASVVSKLSYNFSTSINLTPPCLVRM